MQPDAMRRTRIASAHPSLAWLTDSLQLAIRSGAEVAPVTIRVDGADVGYYAVGITRTFRYTGPPPFSQSSFFLLAFDALSAPTRFVIASGFAGNNTSSLPTSVTGQFGTLAAAGHMIEIVGSSVRDYVASVGSATFTEGTAGAACEGFKQTATLSCFASTLQAALTIALAEPPSVTLLPKTANLATSTVPGILLQRQQ